MLNIVIPMAGRGSRFRDAGYELPKPLIPVDGVPMIALVVQNIRPACPHRFIFLCLQEHLTQYQVRATLHEVAPGCAIIPVAGITEGAACTVLLVEELIDNDDPLMIANSDQYIDVSIDMYLAVLENAPADGLIMTMSANDPKWSYVRFSTDGEVLEVVEKQVVSDAATVGIYNFRRGRDFVWAAHRMINRGMRINNEFYVAPV